MVQGGEDLLSLVAGVHPQGESGQCTGQFDGQGAAAVECQVHDVTELGGDGCLPAQRRQRPVEIIESQFGPHREHEHARQALCCLVEARVRQLAGQHVLVSADPDVVVHVGESAHPLQ